MHKYEVFASVTKSRRAKFVVEAESLGAAVDKLNAAIVERSSDVIYSRPKLSVLSLGGHLAAEEES